MSEGRFVTALIAACVALTPAFFLAWVAIVATVDFHDVLMVACVLCVQYHVAGIRRDRRAREREIRAEVRARTLQTREDEALTWLAEDESIPA